MRAFVVSLALIAGALLYPASASATPGVADQQPCVTWREFSVVDSPGMERAQVERVLDWGGRSNAPRYNVNAAGRYGVETWKHRVYRGCYGQRGAAGTWANSNVHVFYDDDNRVRLVYWFVACLNDCVQEVD